MLESWQLSQLSLPHDPPPKKKKLKKKLTKNEKPLSRVRPVQYSPRSQSPLQKTIYEALFQKCHLGPKIDGEGMPLEFGNDTGVTVFMRLPDAKVIAALRPSV